MPFFLYTVFFEEPKESVTILSDSSHQNFYEGVHYPTAYFRYIIMQGKRIEKQFVTDAA